MKTDAKSSNKKQNNNATSKKKKTKKRNIKFRRIIAIGICILILVIIIVLILLSDMFNIRNISVENNSKVSSEEVIKLSGLEVGKNMFKTFKSSIKNGVKSNPYIEDVDVKKEINGNVKLKVEERTSTFMLKKENEYAYINNQGYILEISDQPIEVPTITGYTTEELIPGERLNVKDLKNLENVIQIMDTAKGNGISDLIKSIDITYASNYILNIPSEGKRVQFGDTENINYKILWIVDLLEREKGIEGDIILNVKDIKKVYFREKV